MHRRDHTAERTRIRIDSATRAIAGDRSGAG
jgi:hypothetical protein